MAHVLVRGTAINGCVTVGLRTTRNSGKVNTRTFAALKIFGKDLDKAHAAKVRMEALPKA